MNRVILIGRLARDPEVRYSQGENPSAIARYSLAVDRLVKKEDAQNADFINCVAFGKQGEFAEKYLHKGMKIAIEGHIQTGNYTNKDGQKVYTTDVVIDRHEFCESKGSAGEAQAQKTEGGNASTPATNDDGFIDIPDDVEDLPFSV